MRGESERYGARVWREFRGNPPALWSLRTVLVRSGKPWREQLALLERAGGRPDAIVDGIGEAVEWIAGEEARGR